MEAPIQDVVEEVESVEDEEGPKGEEGTKGEEDVVEEERTPVASRTYVSWFLTLKERREEAMLLRYRDTQPERLSAGISAILGGLFCNSGTHLFLPSWASEGDSKPTDCYELRYASSYKSERMFAGDYNPILVRRERAGAVVAVVYDGNLFRKERELPMLFEMLDEMVKDPRGYFDRVGKRWGRCLCCKRAITADRSIQQAIGPVCFKRLKNMERLIKALRGDVELPEVGSGEVVSTAYPLNPVERESVQRVTDAYLELVEAGLVFDQRVGALMLPGASVAPRPTTPGTCGELEELYVDRNERWRYMTTVGRARKELALLRVTRETQHTVRVLLQLGAVWREDLPITGSSTPSPGCWTVVRESLSDLALHFRIGRTALDTTSHPPSLDAAMVLAPPPTAASKKKSSPKERTITVTELPGHECIVTGNTYVHRMEIKAAGGLWDGARRGWVAHTQCKPALDALAARVNGLA
jgi:hypothetical protein